MREGMIHLDSKGGIFRASRLALMLASPSPEEISACVSHSLTHALNRAHAILAKVSPAQAEILFGQRRSLVRIGLMRLAKRDTVWFDLLDDESTRLKKCEEEFREAAAQTLEMLPPRLRELRTLAEKALSEALHAASEECLRRAGVALDQLLEQPIGRRDAMSWILRGWVHLCQGNALSAKACFGHGCLAGQGVLFSEASRFLATIQSDEGAYDAAVLTLQRAGNDDPVLAFQRLRVNLIAGRGSQADEELAALIPAWPIAILGLVSEEALLAKANIWRPTLEEVASEMLLTARQETRQWCRSVNEAARCLRELSEDLEFPMSRRLEMEINLRLAGRNDAFSAHRALVEAGRGMANVPGAARSVARSHARKLQEEASFLSNKLEVLKEWHDEQLASIESEEMPTGRKQRLPWELRPREARTDCDSGREAIHNAYTLHACGLSEQTTQARRELRRADALIDLFQNWPTDFRQAA